MNTSELLTLAREKLESLRLTAYCREMSDNYFYISGRAYAWQQLIEEQECEVKRLERLANIECELTGLV
jgi:hypothetical protein